MDKLKNFLNSIEQFYQPKDASEKDGIGHEIEHIKGVIERMHIIAQTINENPSLYQETKVDYNIATTVAALHDIGNTINRDDHNHLGYGIIMGKLTPSDILKAPTKGNTLLSATEKHNILSHFKNNKVTNVENLSPNESSGVQNICKIMTKFDIGYYGSELFKKDQIEDITQTDVAKLIVEINISLYKTMEMMFTLK